VLEGDRWKKKEYKKGIKGIGMSVIKGRMRKVC